MKIRIWGAQGSIPAPLSPNAVTEKMIQAIDLLGKRVTPVLREIEVSTK